jgi:hypothetical protein
MTPNFAPEFRFNAEVEILDETGFPTGRRGYIHARYSGKDNDTPEYAVMLATPPGGSRHFPAALLRLVEARPAAPLRSTPRTKHKKRQPVQPVVTTLVVLHGPPLAQNASAATPRRRAPQVTPQGGESTREQNSTDRPRLSTRSRS